ncbi:MAG TPA: patatin-like phospholipase family protein [Xanthomonadales bacterium]|nr:patatin-like phospholipase family protein [Xanthomonadales bacterium]
MSNMAKKFEIAMAEATSYEEWREAARNLDRIDGKERWREEPESPDYDHKLLASRVKLLRRLRRQKELDRLIFRLREELHGNLGNMANPALYQHARVGTKKLVNAYIDEVCAALDLLCDSDVESLPPMRKRIFMKRAARSFGRSALLLSGGGSLGLFHIGVIRELEEQGILPRVITGSSAGSIVTGSLATHTDAEWEQLLGEGKLKFEWARLIRLTEMGVGKGVLDPKAVQNCIDQAIPDMTFLEAYQHTNRILNISVSPADSHQFPRLLNYLTAPNVLIRRAALASSTIPGVLPPVQLRARNFEGKSVAYMPQNRWIDGSVHDDIPKEKVNRLHNINHYIVSQTNPFVVPFLNEEMDETGLIPFLQDVVIKAPMVQIEHLLELVQQHFKLPGVGNLIKRAHAVARQKYSGDINIFPEKSLFNIGRVFHDVGPRQLEGMILAGRRATWPKIERIRNTTQISRTFDRCLQRMSERYRYVKR